MDTTVQTGQTKSLSGTSLGGLSLESAQGERALLLLQIEADAHDAKSLEKEMGSIIRASLLETEGEASSRLDGTLKELNGLLKGLLLSGTIQDIHAIIGIVDMDGTLHVSHAGRAEAYVVRGSSASQITEYTRGKPTPAFVYVASGALEQGDIVILSTQRLLRAFTPAQLTQVVQRGGDILGEVTHVLEGEKEHASVATLAVDQGGRLPLGREGRKTVSRTSQRQRGSGRSRTWTSLIAWYALAGVDWMRGLNIVGRLPALRSWAESFFRDLRDPKRKKRAHLLLLAGTIAVFLVIWVLLQLTMNSERSKTREELGAIVEQVGTELKTAENRRIAGDIDAANAILERAEERSKQVMDNDRGLYRIEALDLLDRIRNKREEINNIVRLSPRVVANLAAKNPDVTALGFIGLADGEFVAYDRQNIYRVLLNSVENPVRVSDEELIVSGASFPRYQTQVFQTTGNTLIESIARQHTIMKTEDPAGWVTGKSIEAYLRFLYILSPENNQIYKYERLSNRYGPPSPYNVNGDVSHGIDIAIDGNMYVLRDDGTVLKLLRGEEKPFVIRHAPDGLLQDTTRIYKVLDGSMYFLDPVGARVIVVSDGGQTGESTYAKQYVLEGDQIGKLADMYVDPDETHVYVIDEKRIYAVDLRTK
ncbi:hypothetical protein FJZ27_00080 [Candidatus Peribacteria bacterium]|nr:hypothetical protein [Candidatus Peribacteria bacterium]